MPASESEESVVRWTAESLSITAVGIWTAVVLLWALYSGKLSFGQGIVPLAQIGFVLLIWGIGALIVAGGSGLIYGMTAKKEEVVKVEEIAPPNAFLGPHPQAVKAGRFIFVSYQLPLNPVTGQIIKGDTLLQARAVLDSLKNLLLSNEKGLENVIKLTFYVTSLEKQHDIERAYLETFTHGRPAMTIVEVSGLPFGVDVALDAIVRA
ncbi:MAG: hypothetical protein DRO00_06375 [Thermoproteota archaeon]|nr:MAG: hypothetical protein DRO00_06375 [Candidatus Korarchaeota archaeon]